MNIEKNLLFLNNQDIKKLGGEDMELAIKDVENAYSLIEKKDAIAPMKCVLRWGDTPEDENKYGRINAMPGFIGGDYNMPGIKWIGSSPKNYDLGLPRASVTIILNDMETKLPICILDGTAISAKRTGASGGVAIKLLAKENISSMTICGAGAQGRTQLEAAKIVRPNIKNVNIYDINQENIKKFIKESEEKYNDISFKPVNSLSELKEAVKTSDVVDCVTLATEPFIEGNWLKKGALVLNMADYEVDFNTVERSQKIVVDNWDTIKHRMISTVALMFKENIISDKDIYAEIGEIINGKKEKRYNEDEIIYYNAVGTGLLDIAVATRCYKEAVKRKIGTVIPYWR